MSEVSLNEIFVTRRIPDPLDPGSTIVDKVPASELPWEEQQEILESIKKGVVKARPGPRQAPRINTVMTIDEAMQNPFNG